MKNSTNEILEIMTVEKWLSDVYYDEWGVRISNKKDIGVSQLVADIRGWGAIQHLFKTQDEGQKFQNEVGEFIAEAIKEKIQRVHLKIA